MIRLTRSQLQPIGLDLGFDSIKMMQLEAGTDQTLSVHAAARQAVPEEARAHAEVWLPVAMDIVRQMLRNNPFSGRSVVATLPREMVHVKNLRLPMMPPSEVEHAVQFEAKNVFPFDTDDAILRHITAGEVRQGNDTRLEVIVLTARRPEVNDFVEQLHRAGCVIESLDFESCALYRSVEKFIRRREDEGDVNVLIDIGVRRSHVVIGRGREISFYKPIDIGSSQFHDAVARKLDMSREEARSLRRRLIETAGASLDAAASVQSDPVRQAVHDATRAIIEELGREIGLCLRYHSVTFRGQRPTRVRVLGGEAGDPQLIATLGAVLPIPVIAGRPLHNVNTARMKPAERIGGGAGWAVALGLGLKMTRGYFGARDGKPRETAAPVSGGTIDEPAAPAATAKPAEVIDIVQAIAESTPIASSASGMPGISRAQTGREATIHA